jgi:dihydrofolate synthase/folylpolyglutamate synthase
MTYADALARLFALRRFGMRPGLAPIEDVLAKLGHPERAFPAIHVAGTNGKGSTAAMCDAILRAAGKRVGLYTSPHLSRFTERIRIAGVEIDEAEVAAILEEVLAVAPSLTFFEIVTAAAFVAFARAQLDIAIVEVGLGGRLDATNALARPLVSVITNIALDHTEILGNTIEEIAGEKAGILRAGVPAIIGAVDDEARRAIAERAREVGAPLRWLGKDFAVAAIPDHLLGLHQARNAAVARAAILALPPALRPDEDAIARGFADARWPGRLERLAPDLFLDGAHNADGSRALADALPALAAGRPIHLVLGVVEEKDAKALAAPLLPLASRVIATTPPTPRAKSASRLASELGPSVESIDDPLAAVGEARASNALTVVAGSLFLVGQVRARVLGEREDPIVVQDPSRLATTEK